MRQRAGGNLWPQVFDVGEFGKPVVKIQRYYESGASVMASAHLDLGEELGGLLAKLGQQVEQTAREMIVLEMYRRSLISSGKAAILLGIPRLEFIQRASELGIPYFRFTEDEWQAEAAESKRN